MRKRLLTGLILLFLLSMPFSCVTALSEENENGLSQCELRASHRSWLKFIQDGDVDTYYGKGHQDGDYWIEIEAPEGEKLTGMYFIWNYTESPAECLIRNQEDEEWTSLCTVSTGHIQEYLPLDSVQAVRLSVTDSMLSLCELSVFFDDEIPDWVHVWEPTPEKADLLLLVAHPDDEYLFMGGLIPEYAGERQLSFVMAYLCRVGNIRANELLNGLWTAGCHSYPVFLNYPHKTAKTRNSQYEAMGGRDKAMDGVWEMLETYHPEVVVTHDLYGEYGQGAHKVAADLLLGIIRDEERELSYPVKKLYLHLWEENPIQLDWTQPLSSFGGKTGLEVAQEAFACHKSQQGGKAANRRGGTYYFKVVEGGSLDNAAFGLAYSSVGEDKIGNDLMENIPEELLQSGQK